MSATRGLLMVKLAKDLETNTLDVRNSYHEENMKNPENIRYVSITDKACPSDKVDCCTHETDTIVDKSPEEQENIYAFSESNSAMCNNFNNPINDQFEQETDNVSTMSIEIPRQETITISSRVLEFYRSSSTSSESTCNEDRDKDFIMSDYSEESSDEIVPDSEISESEISENQLESSVMTMKIQHARVLRKEQKSISEIIEAKRESTKKETRCKFCNTDIMSKNFARHMETFHEEENEMKHILKNPKGSKARRQAFSLLRRKTNFDLYINGVSRPYRRNKEDKPATFFPCIYCRGLFKKNYLKRHTKVCTVKHPSNIDSNLRQNYITDSQTFTACAMDSTNTISRLNVKEQVFDIMKGDEISFEAKKDLLITQFGESYLKKHKRERNEYACSSRMRELSRLLIAYRTIIDDKTVQLKDILRPENFDNILAATRMITGYDPQKKIFVAPSLAMHLGTYLKLASEELIHLILKQSPGFIGISKEESRNWQSDINNFQKLVESRWNIEISSIANKDLQEKRWTKPLLIPLVNDVKIFREETLKIAKVCQQKFLNNTDSIETFRSLVECTLALVILFNRRRIGDVQYLKISCYEAERVSNFADFENALTETEKVLATKYKRVLNSGKGSRQVVILVPPILQKFISTILKYRRKYVSEENEYVFSNPKSKLKYVQGDVAIRNLTKKMNLQHPEAISSNKLRKHIATVSQILNLSKEEIHQFSKFMGHTVKTHADFYELPIDIFQTAKVSKLLLMMENGSLPVEYKGKTLEDINFDETSEYPEENIGDDGDREYVANKDKSILALEKQSKNISVDLNIDDVEDQAPQRKKPKIKKRSWTDGEILILKEHFSSFIQKKEYPSTVTIKEFIKNTGINRSITLIKSKLQHILKTQK